MQDDVAPIGEGGVMLGGPVVASPCFCEGYAAMPMMARFDAPISTAFPPAESLLASPPTAFSQFRVSETMPAFEANRPLATDQQATTFNILPPGSTVQPDMRISASGEVEIRPGFENLAGRPAQINIAIEEGASQQNVQNAITLLANQFDSRWNTPDIALADPNHQVDQQWFTTFNRQHHHHNPDQHDQDDIHPPPQPDGGHPRPPGPHPPGPDDNNVNPDNNNNDRVNPNDADSVVNPTDAAARTREFIRRFGDVLLHGGGVHNKIIGKWWGKVIPQRIRDLLSALANSPDSEEALQALQGALTENDGAATHEIYDNLGREAQRLQDMGDTDGATALRTFRTQLCGEDGRHPNMQMFRNLGNFLKKVQDGAASPTDVQQMFPGTTPSTNVVAAISRLALHDAANAAHLLNPTVPTNQAERATFMQNYRRDIQQLIMRLQTQPDQFPNLFGN
jgi:hypothetical protein